MTKATLMSAVSEKSRQGNTMFFQFLSINSVPLGKKKEKKITLMLKLNISSGSEYKGGSLVQVEESRRGEWS